MLAYLWLTAQTMLHQIYIYFFAVALRDKPGCSLLTSGPCSEQNGKADGIWGSTGTFPLSCLTTVGRAVVPPSLARRALHFLAMSSNADVSFADVVFHLAERFSENSGKLTEGSGCSFVGPSQQVDTKMTDEDILPPGLLGSPLATVTDGIHLVVGFAPSPAMRSGLTKMLPPLGSGMCWFSLTLF